MGKLTDEFAGFRMGVGYGAGAAANNDITITGIATKDKIIAALEIQPPTASSGDTVKSDLTSEISITAANTVQCSTTDTTGNQVLVFWVVK